MPVVTIKDRERCIGKICSGQREKAMLKKRIGNLWLISYVQTNKLAISVCI
jgi:hypothetical protein